MIKIFDKIKYYSYDEEKHKSNNSTCFKYVKYQKKRNRRQKKWEKFEFNIYRHNIKIKITKMKITRFNLNNYDNHAS